MRDASTLSPEQKQKILEHIVSCCDPEDATDLILDVFSDACKAHIGSDTDGSVSALHVIRHILREATGEPWMNVMRLKPGEAVTMAVRVLDGAYVPQEEEKKPAKPKAAKKEKEPKEKEPKENSLLKSVEQVIDRTVEREMVKERERESETRRAVEQAVRQAVSQTPSTPPPLGTSTDPDQRLSRIEKMVERIGVMMKSYGERLERLETKQDVTVDLLKEAHAANLAELEEARDAALCGNQEYAVETAHHVLECADSLASDKVAETIKDDTLNVIRVLDRMWLEIATSMVDANYVPPKHIVTPLEYETGEVEDHRQYYAPPQTAEGTPVRYAPPVLHSNIPREETLDVVKEKPATKKRVKKKPAVEVGMGEEGVLSDEKGYAQEGEEGVITGSFGSEEQ